MNITAEEKATAFIATISEPDDKSIAYLQKKYANAEIVELLTDEKYAACPPQKLATNAWTRLRSRAQIVDIKKVLGQSEKLGAKIIFPGCAAWPALLDDVTPHVRCLWVRGSLAALHLPTLAIVGARASSMYGQNLARNLAFQAGQAGFSVISGGAIGIDIEAHLGALAANSPTVVVLAGGVDRIYPQRHSDIFQQILEGGGALISEHAPGAIPSRFRFLARNRLIAALARTTVVVEAALRSGALVTAEKAAQLGRRVLAFPGPVTSVVSEGCHELIKNGVELAARVDDVLAAMDLTKAKYTSDFTEQIQDTDLLFATCSRQEAQVLDAISPYRCTSMESICLNSGLSLIDTMQVVAQIEANGKIKREETGWMRR